jgi:hypothetical protein
MFICRWLIVVTKPLYQPHSRNAHTSGSLAVSGAISASSADDVDAVPRSTVVVSAIATSLSWSMWSSTSGDAG